MVGSHAGDAYSSTGVGCALHFHGAMSKVSPQKSQVSGCLSRNRICMSVPTKVVADGKAEKLSTVNSFKDVTMEPVYGVSLVVVCWF